MSDKDLRQKLSDSPTDALRELVIDRIVDMFTKLQLPDMKVRDSDFLALLMFYREIIGGDMGDLLKGLFDGQE